MIDLRRRSYTNGVFSFLKFHKKFSSFKVGFKVCCYHQSNKTKTAASFGGVIPERRINP